MGRLALNPDDAEALDAVANWFNPKPADGNDTDFNYPAIALLANRYWDKFTQAQRNTLRDSMKDLWDFWSHGTENHALMRATGNSGGSKSHIDRLAAESMVFTQGYATCQVGSPSRVNIMPGRFNEPL